MGVEYISIADTLGHARIQKDLEGSRCSKTMVTELEGGMGHRSGEGKRILKPSVLE